MRKIIVSGLLLSFLILSILVLRNVFSNVSAAPPEKPSPPQASGTIISFNFDSEPPGAMPAKFHSARTGQGSDGKWAVMAAPTAPSTPNVVAQTSTDKTDYRFPLLISDEGSFKDLELSVKFKAVAGEVDRAAGLVFRLQDANNYYIVRANALEDNYRLYHVVKGSRRQFAGTNFKVTSSKSTQLPLETYGI